MDESQLKGMRPTYVVFHKWLAKNRKRIAAGKDRTVIYSGLDSGRAPIWTKLPLYEKYLSLDLDHNPRWQPIQEVLEGMPCTVSRHADTVELPGGVAKFRTMWDFASQVVGKKYVTTHEGQQIWKNLSANDVRNATGEVYVFVGSTLKKYPDMLLAEIPVLMKNKNLSPESQERIIKLIPSSQAVIEKYREDTSKNRTAGRR